MHQIHSFEPLEVQFLKMKIVNPLKQTAAKTREIKKLVCEFNRQATEHNDSRHALYLLRNKEISNFISHCANLLKDLRQKINLELEHFADEFDEQKSEELLKKLKDQQV